MSFLRAITRGSTSTTRVVVGERRGRLWEGNVESEGRVSQIERVREIMRDFLRVETIQAR